MYNETPTEIEAKIAEKEAEISKLKKKLETFQGLTPERQLATTLHKNLCHWNHTDGCAWYYRDDKAEETWAEKGERARWLEKARNILAETDIETATKIIELL